MQTDLCLYCSHKTSFLMTWFTYIQPNVPNTVDDPLALLISSLASQLTKVDAVTTDSWHFFSQNCGVFKKFSCILHKSQLLSVLCPCIVPNRFGTSGYLHIHLDVNPVRGHMTKMFLNHKLGHFSSSYNRQKRNMVSELYEPQHDKLCAQRRLRSAWASAQSDQSIRCPHDESLDP